MRDLPKYNIGGKTFLVDVSRNEFRQEDDALNRIAFSNMEYFGTHYRLEYDKHLNNVPIFFDLHKNNVIEVTIPPLVQLDPIGMALKYNLKPENIAGKTDFDLIVDQDLFHQRSKMGKLPKIDIAGDKFIIDLRMSELRLDLNFFKKISLDRDRLDYHDNYTFFYRPSSKEPVHFLGGNNKLPKGVLMVELPPIFELDPYAIARDSSSNIQDFLIKHPIQKDLRANILPPNETRVALEVKRNNIQLLEKKAGARSINRKGRSL